MPGPIASCPPRMHWRGHDCYVMLELGWPDPDRLLATAAQLRADVDGPRRLHYIAVTPLLPDWPAQADDAEQSAFTRALAENWPLALPGFHRVGVGDERIVLTVVIGAIEAALAQLGAQADAIHVHAGLPWSPALVKWLGRLAAPQAVLSAAVATDSFSACLPALHAAGFAEIGIENAGAGSVLQARFAPRWKAAPSAPCTNERHAIVVGAGLAGAAICENLSARGWRVDLIEQHGGPAREASGNAAGIFMPQLTRDESPAARLSRAAFLFALQSWRRLGGVGNAFEGELCGALQLARAMEHEIDEPAGAHRTSYPAQFARQVGAQEASALLGVEAAAGWLFAQAGWLHPGGLCAALLRACGDQVWMHFDTRLADLQRLDGRWHAFDSAQRCIATAPVLILASGRHARQLPMGAGLPLEFVRGQVTHVPSGMLPPVPLVICGDGYLTPANAAGFCSLGASYEPGAADDLTVHARAHADNLARLASLVPPRRAPLLNGLEPAQLAGRAGVRCVSPDRLPLVGALPDHAAAGVKAATPLADWPRLPQAYGLLAYASRGVVWSALAAELLAAQLEGEPLPLPRDLAAALDPARFAWKEARRRPPAATA